MIYFTADYADRQELLSLGAKWDFTRWAWRADFFSEYEKFSRWIDGNIIASEVYAVKAETRCPACGKRAKVAAVAFGEYREDFLPKVYGAGQISFLNGLEGVGGELAQVLKSRFGVIKRYAEGYGYKYLSNGCNRCGLLFPEETLFGEGAPFGLSSQSGGAELEFYPVGDGADIALRGSVIRAYDTDFIRARALFFE